MFRCFVDHHQGELKQINITINQSYFMLID